MADFEPKIARHKTHEPYSVLVDTTESGHKVRRLQRDNPILWWEIECPPLTYAEMDAIRTFYQGKSGAYGTFTFTDPDDGVTVHTVAFMGEPDIETIEAKLFYRVSFKLEKIY